MPNIYEIQRFSANVCGGIKAEWIWKKWRYCKQEKISLFQMFHFMSVFPYFFTGKYSVLPWHSRGQRFDPAYLHQKRVVRERRLFSFRQRHGREPLASWQIKEIVSQLNGARKSLWQRIISGKSQQVVQIQEKPIKKRNSLTNRNLQRRWTWILEEQNRIMNR